MIIISRLDVVEEPHGVEETHSSVASLRLLPLHLQQSGEDGDDDSKDDDNDEYDEDVEDDGVPRMMMMVKMRSLFEVVFASL